MCASRVPALPRTGLLIVLLMPSTPEQRLREAITLIDVFIEGNLGDRLQHLDSRRLGEVRAILTGSETMRSLGEIARRRNQKRTERAERLLRFVPRRVRAALLDRRINAFSRDAI